MNFWMLLWQITLVISLVAFSLLSVVVTIGGALDIFKLFRRLKELHSQGDPEDPS
ncbi:MAG: hypothetical protein AB7P49_19455 [Bdellovibrionales bacterium]